MHLTSHKMRGDSAKLYKFAWYLSAAIHMCAAEISFSWDLTTVVRTPGDGGYSSKDSKDSGAMYGAVTGSGQQHMMHAQQQQAPQQQQQQQQQLPRDAYPAYGAMPQQGAAAGFGGQQYGGQYGYQQYGQGHGGGHVGNGPAGTFKMQ